MFLAPFEIGYNEGYLIGRVSSSAAARGQTGVGQKGLKRGLSSKITSSLQLN